MVVGVVKDSGATLESHGLAARIARAATSIKLASTELHSNQSAPSEIHSLARVHLQSYDDGDHEKAMGSIEREWERLRERKREQGREKMILGGWERKRNKTEEGEMAPEPPLPEFAVKTRGDRERKGGNDDGREREVSLWLGHMPSLILIHF